MPKRVDKATANETARLRDVLEQSPAGVSIISRDHFERLFINSRMIELLGISDNVTTPGIDTFFRTSDYDWVMEQLAAGAVVDAVEFERRRVDTGQIWWSSMHARPTVFEGREAGIIWLYDISDLKRMETKLRQLAATQSDWLWEIDENFCVVSFSDNFYAQTGMRRDEVEGLDIESWGRMSRASPDVFERFLKNIRAHEPVRNIEFERKDQSGSKWVRLNAVPIWEGGVFKGYYGSTTDITELHRSRKRLVETERAAALGGLVAGVAHEINTPLGVSVTALSVIDDDTKNFQKAYREGTLTREEMEIFLDGLVEGIEILTSNLHRSADLVRNFKQVAVDQTSDVTRRINLRDYINQVIASLSPRLKTVCCEVVLQGESDIEVDTYPGAIAQILTNLIENSLIHAYDNGGPGVLRIDVGREDGAIRLVFADDGKGMPPEVSHRIFEPFFTTARGRGGSGLGMHIVHNLVVQRLKGAIDCRSHPGEGTTIEIILPDPLEG